MRGVPRDRSAIRRAPSASMGTPRMPADRMHDRLEFVDVVEVEPADEPEPVAQRPGDQPGAGGGPDQGEPGQVEPDAAGGRALADEDVELEVLHGRIEDLLHRPVQPVDLVDEEDVALLEVGEQGGQVAGPDQHRPRGDPQPDAHLGGHDAGQRGLAQARAARRTAGGRPAGRRLRAASMTIRRCSVSWPWPTNSPRVRGRRPASSASSAGAATGSTGRSHAGSRCQPGPASTSAGTGQHLLRAVGRHRCAPARAGRSAPAPRPARRRPRRRARRRISSGP